MGNNNIYGVYEDGSSPLLWVKTVAPLVLDSSDHAAVWSDVDAASVAVYLSGDSANAFRVGRPGDRQPH